MSNKDFIGCTAKELFKTMDALAGSAKLRKGVEDYYRKQGMHITIDKCGMAYLYTPLYVSKPRCFPKATKKPSKVLCNKKAMKNNLKENREDGE